MNTLEGFRQISWGHFLVEESLVGGSTGSVSLMVEFLFSDITIEIVENLNGCNKTWVLAWGYRFLLYLQGVKEEEHREDEKVTRVTHCRIQVNGEDTRETETASKD